MRRLAALAAAVVVAAGAAGLAGIAFSRARARSLADRGWRQLAAGEVAAATGSFGRAVSIRGDCHYALRGLGESRYTLWRRQPSSAALRELARDAFRRALAESPADLPTRVRLLHLGMFSPAEGTPLRAFAEAAALSAARPADRRLQRCFLDLALDAAAVPALRETLFADPGRRAPVVAAGALLTSRGETGFEDIEPLTRPPFGKGEALAVAAGSAKALRALVERVLAEGGLPGWMEEARRGGDDRFHLETVRQLAEARRWPEARAVAGDWIAAHPDDAAAHGAAAGAWYGAGGEEWAVSERHYREAVRLAPGDVRYRRSYAERLVARGMWACALEELEVARRLAPGDASVHYLSGLAWAGAGRRGEALDELRRAAALAPGNQSFRRALEKAGGGG